MRHRRYGLLGWIVWKVGVALAKRRVRKLRVKAVAALVVAGVLAAGTAAARAGD